METRKSNREIKEAKLRKFMVEMGNTLLDEVARCCTIGKEVAAEVWDEEWMPEDMRQYGEGERNAYDNVLRKLEELRGELASLDSDTATR